MTSGDQPARRSRRASSSGPSTNASCASGLPKRRYGTRQAGGEHVRGELAEPAAEPALLRRDEAELVAPLAHRRRQQIAERAPQHRLRLPAADELTARKREAELDEPVVQERHAGLERVGHRVPVLVTQQLGESPPREDQLLVA